MGHLKTAPAWLGATSAGLFAWQAAAQTSDASAPDTIVVTGYAATSLLDQPADTGSRLGLTPLETPASLDIISADTMSARAYATVADAVGSFPGVVSGESPAAPSTFSIRGFTRSQITFLRDGLWVGPTNMVMRPQNTFNLERIELLRGPASAVYGQGAVSGVINAVTKQAAAEDAPIDALAAYGRFDTVELGLGTGGRLAENLWYRADASHYRSDGYVDGMDPRSTNLTGALLWRASDQLDVRLSADYLDDELPNYWGTPLTPISFSQENATDDIIETTTGETVDRRILRTNYNVEDGLAESQQLFVRNDVDYRLSDRVTLSNTLWGFTADRDWANAEGFIFNAETEQIDRTNGYFFVLHEQEMLGDRLQARIEHDIGGFESQTVAGFEIVTLDFERTRGFRFAPQPGDSVDFLDPDVGVYGERELRGVSPTTIDTRALYAENRVQLSEQLSLVTGIRQEWLDLDRDNFGRNGEFEAGSSFERDFSNVSWRVGGTYEPVEGVSLYAQYATATDPVNANIFLVNSAEDFDLTDARSWEIGAKGVLLDGRANVTAAYYDIERDDVLEQIGIDSASIVGGRSARGVELSGSLAVTDQLAVSANAAYTDAEFEPSANFVENAGNRPPNVPEFTATVFGEYRDIAGLPVDVGASVRHVGDRFGDNANTVTLLSYQVVGARAAYRFNENAQLSLHVDNVFDAEYAPWADVFYLQQTDPSFPYANQVLIGEPRTYQVRFVGSF